MTLEANIKIAKVFMNMNNFSLTNLIRENILPQGMNTKMPQALK
jgi:hypothetical protein